MDMNWDLLMAVDNKDVIEVEKLLMSGANVNARNHLGETPLIRAGSLNMIDLLLKHGADINAQDANGYSALHNAIHHVEVDTINKLLVNGADFNIQDKNGVSPVIEATIACEDHENALDILKKLLEVGADHTLTRLDGKSALEIAGMNNLSDVIDILIHYPEICKENRLLQEQIKNTSNDCLEKLKF